jgi:opacity protein-like surface antigen
MRLLTIATALGLLAALAAPAARADEPDFGRPGFYVGGGATYGFNLFDSAFDDLFSDVQVGDTWGFYNRLGYRPLRWLAVEAEYEYLHDFGVRAEGVHLADLRAQTITANVRFIGPWRFQPYFLLGAGASLFSLNDNGVPGLEVDHSSFAGRIGIGLDTYVTQNLVIAVGADTVLTTAQVKDPVFSGDSSSTLSYVAVHMGIDLRF